MTRFRNRVRALGEGGAQWITPGLPALSTVSFPTQRATCTDEFGKRNMDFITDNYFCNGAAISHVYTMNPTTGEKKILKNFTPAGFQNPSISHQTDPSLPSFSVLAVLALKRTNPSAPVVDLPVSLLELRELPDLLRRFGNNVFQRIADGNLRFEFGVKPVISDIVKMCDFAKSVDNRMKLLKKLQQGPITRKVALYDSVVTTTPNTNGTTNSLPSWLVCNHRFTRNVTSIKVWGYVTWTPQPAFKNISMFNEQRLKFLARRIVFGSSIDASTLWNALPWSWLADWFTNIGDYLVAHRSMIPVVASTPAICITTTSVRTHVMNTSNFGLGQGDHTCTVNLITKRRRLASASLPSTYMPFFTGRQMGILASLAALKWR